MTRFYFHRSTASRRPLRYLILMLITLVSASAGQAADTLEVLEHQADLPISTPEDIVISPDDRHVYVLGEAALATFERNLENGHTQLVETHFEGLGDIQGLRRTTALAITRDGRYLYTASPLTAGDDGVDRTGVAIFEREPADGRLSLREVHTDGFTATLPSFQAAYAVLSPDDRHLYVVSGPDEAVLAFERDPADGGLRALSATPQGMAGGTFRAFAAFDPTGKHLYVTNAGRGSVLVYQRDSASGGLRRIQQLRSPNPRSEKFFPVHPGAVLVSPSGDHVYVVNTSAFPFDAGDGQVFRFRRAPSGRLSIRDAGDIQAAPLRMAFSPDGKNLYVPGAGSYIAGASEIVVYERNAVNGKTRVIQAVHETSERFDQNSNTKAVAVTADGRHLYAGAFGGRSLKTFTRRAAHGRLALKDDPNDPTGGLGQLTGASRGVVSPDGRHLYVASPGDSRLSVYRRNPQGRLSLVQVLSNITSRMDTVGMSPGGRFVYAFDQVFRRRSGSGRLVPVEQNALMDLSLSAEDMVTSPDGRYLYVASRDGFREGVRIFRQGQARGFLGRLETRLDPVPGLGQLRRSRAVAISSDGAYIYALGLFEKSLLGGDEVDAIWVFRRSAETGEVELVDRDVIGPTDHRAAAGRLALSPDDRHLYVTQPNEDRLRVYEHDRQRGKILRLEHHENDQAGVAGLDEPRDVEMSPAGDRVYIAGRRSNAIAVFERDAESGGLRFVEAVGHDEVGGLFRVEDLTLSPDGEVIYAFSPRLASVTALRRLD